MINKLQNFKKLLTEEKCDAFLVVNSEDSGQPATRYISGFSGTSSIILITKKDKYLITDGRYTEKAKSEAKGFKTIIQTSKNPINKILNELLTKPMIESILIDGSETTYSFVEKIKSLFPKVNIISKSGILKETRVVKDDVEIGLLRKASEIAIRAYNRLMPEIQAGMTEKFLASRLDAISKEEGADGMSFDTIVAFGENTALPHSTPTDRKLKIGDLIMIDWGVVYQGYVSDTTRTVAFGKISKKFKDIYEAVETAQELACQKIKAGVKAELIDNTCRDFLKKKGLEKYFVHSTGHGIGLEIHELPVIAGESQHLLQAGNVITCEPGVYIAGVGGVRIEDSLVVTEKGAENLTEKISKKLKVINPIH